MQRRRTTRTQVTYPSGCNCSDWPLYRRPWNSSACKASIGRRPCLTNNALKALRSFFVLPERQKPPGISIRKSLQKSFFAGVEDAAADALLSLKKARTNADDTDACQPVKKASSQGVPSTAALSQAEKLLAFVERGSVCGFKVNASPSVKRASLEFVQLRPEEDLPKQTGMSSSALSRSRSTKVWSWSCFGKNIARFLFKISLPILEKSLHLIWLKYCRTPLRPLDAQLLPLSAYLEVLFSRATADSKSYCADSGSDEDGSEASTDAAFQFHSASDNKTCK